MINMLKQFFMRIFAPPCKTTLQCLFKETPELQRAVLLEETSPLSGLRLIYNWQQYADECRLLIRESNLRQKTERTVAQRTFSAVQFSEMISQIEQAGGASIGNFVGAAKDGVHYCVSWGIRVKLEAVTITNPQVGSRKHYDFVQMIKGYAADGKNPKGNKPTEQSK